MKRILYLILVITLVSMVACSKHPLQNTGKEAINDVEDNIGSSNPLYQLYPIYDNGLWGFIDQNGNVKVKPEYKEVGVFNDYGIALVITDYANPHEIDSTEHDIIYNDAICSIINYTGKVLYDNLILENYFNYNENNDFNVNLNIFLDKLSLVFKTQQSTYSYVKIDPKGNIVQTYKTVEEDDYENQESSYTSDGDKYISEGHEGIIDSLESLPKYLENCAELIAEGYNFTYKNIPDTESNEGGFSTIYGLINPAGKELLKTEWSNMTYLGDGVFQLVNINDDIDHYIYESSKCTFYNVSTDKIFEVDCVEALKCIQGLLVFHDET